MRVRSWQTRCTYLIFAGLAVLTAARGLHADTNAAIDTETETRLRRDVTFLASDACEGRGVLTEGIRKAADYIVQEFRKAGLKPGGVDGTYFQPFTYPATILEAPATLSVRGPKGQVITYKTGVDFNPMGIGHAGTIDGLPVVFAGYGISSEADPAYDDYAKLDVADKVVVVLRDAPRAGAPRQSAFGSRDRRRVLGSMVRKVATAEQKHAAAVILVNDGKTAADGDDLLDFNFTALAGGKCEIPVLHVRRAVLETMLAGGAEELRSIERAIDKDLEPQSRTLDGWSVNLTLKMKHGQIAMKNIIGVLDGAGPRADETVVVGAHYDHLGFGGPFNRSFFASRARPKKMVIHPGADDNGSGTASLLEMARYFGRSPATARRRLVFMAFSGEEINLLGSDHYVKHPIFPLDRTVAMINLDMVGRLRPDGDTKKDKLYVEGTGTAKNFDTLVDETNKKFDFTLKKKPSGNGPSDHESFYHKNIPALFIWSYYHEDYHTPRDTADRLNIPGMRKIVEYAESLIAQIATGPNRPEFVHVGEPPSVSSYAVPHLGIRPSNDDADETDGVLLAEVVKDGPADRGGVKAGDRIVEVDGVPVDSLAWYMYEMRGRKQSGILDVVILRDGKRIPLKIKLD